jgi:alkanesulfonate monooxygenase SsuD/methylene tetrahydromethanopterin reductase-like flavin-dependent oxidoreductase (luciferase family)
MEALGRNDMKVGLFLNTQFPEGDSLPARLPELVEQVRLARESGFASLWFPDHYIIGPVQMPQPVPLMAWLMREAEGMVIGPNIRILPLLNPVTVAEESATLDLLSGGRYVLGVGLGYREAEFTAFGISLAERAARFGESIGLMRRLFTEEKVTHQGKFYTVKDASLSCRPVSPGGPPIYVAAMVEAAVKRAARIGDAWLIVNSATIGTVEQQMAVYRATLAAAGRAPREYPIARECYVGASHATAFEECRAALRYKYAAYASWGLGGGSAAPTDEAMFGMPFEEFVRNRFIIGDKVSVKEEVARYRETLGVDHFVMRVQWPGLPQEKTLGSIRRLGEIFG